MSRARNPVFLISAVISAALIVISLIPNRFTSAQDGQTRVVGSATAVTADSITVKPDHGADVTLAVGSGAHILETQPGAKTLAGAKTIALSGINPGDRVLVIARPAANGSGLSASMIIAMKASAIAESHAAEEAEWQKNGIGGLVKTVDATAGTVTIESGARIVTIATTPKTIIRRYSPDSVAFSASTPSTLAAIHPGDQLRARGVRSADGSRLTAAAMVSGSFRDIAGVIKSVDTAANTVTVRDLKTKKPIVIHITAESQMHEIPAPMARYLAARLRREAGKTEGHGHGGYAHAERGHAGAAHAEHAEWQPGQARNASISQMLDRTPRVTLASLHKGQALMIVATEGTPGSATAVTVLSGVEPILTAPPSATASMFSASWNVGGNQQGGAGGETGAGAGGTP